VHHDLIGPTFAKSAPPFDRFVFFSHVFSLAFSPSRCFFSSVLEKGFGKAATGTGFAVENAWAVRKIGRRVFSFLFAFLRAA